MISKIVLKSDVWPGSEKCGFNPKFEDNDLKLGCYRVPKLPPLSVKHVCPISHKTNPPIMIPKIVLKSVLWRCSESAQYFCIFQLLCFSLRPTTQQPYHGFAMPTFWAHLFYHSSLLWTLCPQKMVELSSQIALYIRMFNWVEKRMQISGLLRYVQTAIFIFYKYQRS